MKLLSIFFILAFGLSAFGQERFTAKVKIYVQHTSSNSQKDAVYSYIARELRVLGDVEIVSDNQDYIIDVMMLDIMLGERLTGYALSVSFEKQAKCIYKEKYIDGNSVILDCRSVERSSISLSSLDKLKENAQRTAANFDTQILDTDRQFFNRNRPTKKSN